jgi:hypothetical protein
MASIEDIALFESFSQGKLHESDLENFQKRLKDSPAFKSDYEKYLLVLESVKQQQAFKKRIVQFNEWYKEKDRFAARLNSDEIQPAGGAPLIPIVLTAIVSIGLTALFFIFFFSSSSNSESVIADEIEPVEIENVTEDAIVAKVADTISQVIEQPEAVAEKLVINTFMISQSGYFLTQYSKIKDAKSYRIWSPDSSSYKATLVHYDLLLDLALLKVDKSEIKNKGTLVFRLATTQAGSETEVMAVAFQEELDSFKGEILKDESVDSNSLYGTDIRFDDNCTSVPVISKNGNIVGVGLQKEGNIEILKSLVVVAWLNKSVEDGKLPDYIMSTENRLSGLESQDQLKRLSPFVGKVLLFY